MTGDTDPTEIPAFVADSFLEGHDDRYIEKTELVSKDPTWQGHGPVPDQRRAALFLATGLDGAVVIEEIQGDHPEDKLVFSRIEPAVERYEESVERVAEAEAGMVSAAGRVTIEREPAEELEADIEFDVPSEVKPKVQVDANPPTCNRCGVPVPEDEQETIGDIVFCPDCHDAVCGRCGTVITDPDNRYTVEGVGAGTTCSSCTASHVDWLCSECEAEIRDEESRLTITDGGVSGTYCRDCGTEIRARIKEESIESGETDPPF